MSQNAGIGRAGIVEGGIAAPDAIADRLLRAAGTRLLGSWRPVHTPARRM
ncbi:hypothetical protein ACWDUL_35100 [Nocardia niigatensis]